MNKFTVSYDMHTFWYPNKGLFINDEGEGVWTPAPPPPPPLSSKSTFCLNPIPPYHQKSLFHDHLPSSLHDVIKRKPLSSKYILKYFTHLYFSFCDTMYVFSS